MKKIHYVDDGSTYIVENTGNITNNPIYQIKKLEPSNKTIAYLNYESNERGLVISLSLTDVVNNQVYDTNYHYDEQNRLHNISTPGEVDHSLTYEDGKIATVIFDNGNDKEIYKINYIDNKIDFIEKQDNHHTRVNYFYDLSNGVVGYKCHSNDSSVCPSIGEDGFLKEEFVLKSNSSKVVIDIKKSFDDYYQFTKYDYDQKNDHLASEKNTRLLGFFGKDKISEKKHNTKDLFYDEEGKLIYDGKTKVIYDPMGSSLQVNSDGHASIHAAFSVVDVHTNKISNNLFNSLTGLGASFEGKKLTQLYMLDLTGNVMPILEEKTFGDGAKDFFGGIWNFARDVNPFAIYLNLAGYDSPLPVYGNESYGQRMKGYGYGIYSASPMAVFTGDFHFFSIKHGFMHSLQVIPVVGSLAQAAYYRYYNAPSMAYYYMGTASADFSVLLLTTVISYVYEKLAPSAEVGENFGKISNSERSSIGDSFSRLDDSNLKGSLSNSSVKDNGFIRIDHSNLKSSVSDSWVKVDGGIETELISGQNGRYIRGELKIIDEKFEGHGVYYGSDDKPIYIGEFKNSQFNGKGSLFDGDQLRFEGEFKDGVLIYGKEYEYAISPELAEKFQNIGNIRDILNLNKELQVRKNTIVYEGEFQNNKYHGQGKLYDRSGKLQYEGAFNHGLYEGDGTLYYNNGQIYKGQFKDGKRHGIGEYYAGNKKVSGYFERDKLIRGKQYSNDILEYQGEFKDFKLEGFGTQYYPDGEVGFEGYFKEGKFSNGKGYNKKGELMYEGDIQNGKYHGNGVEYNADGITKKYQGNFDSGTFTEGRIYQNNGNYIETKFNNGNYNSGKIYDANEKLIYEGNIKNGQYHGQGVEYQYTYDHPDGVKQFEGQFHNGQLIKGDVYYEDGNIIYSGALKNGKYDGKGTLYWYETKEIKHYEGTFQNGKIAEGVAFNREGHPVYMGEFNESGLYHGKGFLYNYEGGSYSGSFIDGLPEGRGKIHNSANILSYDGDMYQGKPHGEGTLYYSTGEEYYTGSFDQNSFIHGEGTMYYKNGKKMYEGQWINGKYQGKGKLYYESGGEKYVGTFTDGVYEGKGVIYYENHNIFYEGDFYKGQTNGNGIFYHENGIKAYKGRFVMGEENGLGTRYYPDGSIAQEGRFENGELVAGYFNDEYGVRHIVKEEID